MCVCMYVCIYIYIETSLYFCITVIKMVGKYTYYENNGIRNNDNHVKKRIQINKKIL